LLKHIVHIMAIISPLDCHDISPSTCSQAWDFFGTKFQT